MNRIVNIPATPTTPRKEVTTGEIVVSRVYKGNYQAENTLTAELKQTIVTNSFYAKKSVSSNHQDNPFSMEEFGIGENEPIESSETRVAWIDVPADSTVETVTARLKMLPNANLYKVLSNKPVLTDLQERGIAANLTTLDVIADRQAIRYPKGSEKEGKLILDPNGKPQYRSVYFRSAGEHDKDLRTADPQDFYATLMMKSELAIGQNAIIENQEVL